MLFVVFVYNGHHISSTFYVHLVLWCGLAVTVGLDQRSYSIAGWVSNGMSDVCRFDLRPSARSWYITSHPDQLSLAIPPWVGAMSTS